MKKIGFPRMHKEINEKRDFLPELFRQLKEEDAEFYLEKGYGKDMGFTEEEYINANPKIRFVDNKECYEKDTVVVLRSPEFAEINFMKNGSTLISMLHYPTRKSRTELLKKKNIFAISLDAIRNDLLERIVVNYSGTSGYGIAKAFDELSKTKQNFYSKDRGIIHISIIGMGMVGLTAAKAARIYGCTHMNDKMKEIGAKGVLIKLLPKNITSDLSEMISLMEETDILVDASTRENVSEYIIKNDFLKYLKDHAILLDLTADPYLLDTDPMQVKAIEGMPTGTLDQTVFYPSDIAYDAIPKGVSTANRRTVVSCNAWPGIRPLECMEIYGMQMLPIMMRVIREDLKSISASSNDFFTRAIYRGTIAFYEKKAQIPGLEIGTALIPLIETHGGS